MRTLALGVSERMPVDRSASLLNAVAELARHDEVLHDEIRARSAGTRVQMYLLAAVVPSLAAYLVVTMPGLAATLGSGLGRAVLVPAAGGARGRGDRRQPAHHPIGIRVIVWGALCAVVSVAAAISAARRDTRVERRLALLLPALARGSRWRPVSDRDLDQSAVRRTQNEVASVKMVGLLTGAVIGGCAGNALGIGGPAAIACAYAGFVLPSLSVERRARARRRAAERSITMLFERLEALTCAGRPAETALAAVSRVATGSPLLDAVLRGSADAYALGAPLFRSLAVRAEAEGLVDLAAMAVELERSRDLGQGSVAVIRGCAGRGTFETANTVAGDRSKGRGEAHAHARPLLPAGAPSAGRDPAVPHAAGRPVRLSAPAYTDGEISRA